MTVTVLAGFWRAATEAVVDRLLLADPELTVLSYDADDGAVRRSIRTRSSPGSAELMRHEDGDVRVAVQRDLLRTLADLSRAQSGHDVAVLLPEVMEPENVITSLTQPAGSVTVVLAEHLLDALVNADDLTSLGIQAAPDDERSPSDVVARQIEQADTVVLWGRPPDADDWETDQLTVLLHRLAPWARHVRLLPEDRDPAAVATGPAGRVPAGRPPVQSRSLLGHPVGVHEPLAQNGVVSAVFRARRPFHPARLQDALDDVTDGVLRSRGVFWLAGRPDLVLAWESAGGLSLGPLGTWLAHLSETAWADVDDERRLAAAIEWDPYYDDRHTHLVFIGLDLDPVALHRRLTGCLLTDDELADGPQVWRQYPDPFRRCYHPADRILGAAGAGS